MPDKTNQTTHQETAGKNTPTRHTWPSPGPLTPWSLTGGSESCGSVTRECEMPEAEAMLPCSAWKQTGDFQTTHVKKNKAVSRHVFTHFTGIYWGGRPLEVCDMSQVMPRLSQTCTQTHQVQQLWHERKTLEKNRRMKDQKARYVKMWDSSACMSNITVCTWLSESVSHWVRGYESSVTHRVFSFTSLSGQILTN